MGPLLSLRPFHPLSRDVPLGLFEIDLGPFALDHLVSSHEDQCHELHCQAGDRRAIVEVNPPQQFG